MSIKGSSNKPIMSDYIPFGGNKSAPSNSCFKIEGLKNQSNKGMSFKSGHKRRVVLRKGEKIENSIDDNSLHGANLGTSITSKACTAEAQYALFFSKEFNSEQKQKILEELFPEDVVIPDDQFNDILTSSACTTEAKYALFFSKKVNENQKQKVLEELFPEDVTIPDDQFNDILTSSACTTEARRALFLCEKVSNEQKIIIVTNHPEVLDEHFKKYKDLKNTIDKKIWNSIASMLQHVDLLKLSAWVIDNEDPVLFACISKRIDSIILNKKNIYVKLDLNYFLKKGNEILEIYKENKQKIKEIYEKSDNFLKLINENGVFNANSKIAEFLRPSLFEEKVSEEIIEKLNEKLKQENNFENRIKLNIMMEAFMNKSDLSLDDIKLEQNKKVQGERK